MLNLTSMQMTKVDWPGHPPLALLPNGDQIMQILIWMPVLNRWVRIGTQGRSLDGQTASMTFDEVRYVAKVIESGATIAQAFAMLFPG